MLFILLFEKIFYLKVKLLHFCYNLANEKFELSKYLLNYNFHSLFNILFSLLFIEQKATITVKVKSLSHFNSKLLERSKSK